MARMRILATSCVLVASVVVGCGDSGSVKLVPVTGSVTFQNAPVAGANITFVPESGPVATGVTDDQGKFHLVTGTRKGAVVGTSKVSISLGSGSDMLGDNESGMSEEEQMMALTQRMGESVGRTGQEGRKSALPSKYAKAETSGLEADVQSSGTNDFPFDLR